MSHHGTIHPELSIRGIFLHTDSSQNYQNPQLHRQHTLHVHPCILLWNVLQYLLHMQMVCNESALQMYYPQSVEHHVHVQPLQIFQNQVPPKRDLQWTLQEHILYFLGMPDLIFPHLHLDRQSCTLSPFFSL